jgi:hypothetical protein
MLVVSRPGDASMHWQIRQWVLIGIVGGFGWVLCAAQAQTSSLERLAYRDPRPLNALLAREDPAFGMLIQRDWAKVARTLAMFVPPGADMSGVSLFFSAVQQRCTQDREVAACRLYLDFLSFLMAQKRDATASTGMPLPVLLRPAQLPFKSTAVLDALATLDAASLQSALSAHWDWMHQIIERYLPDHYSLYPMSKVFASVRETCQRARTEVACRLHLADINSIVDNNRQQAPTLFRTLDQLPYRNPAPLYRLQQLSPTQWEAQRTQWSEVDALLNRYIAGSVAIVGHTDFARARLDCQTVMPGDFGRCQDYLARLAELMRHKQAPISPFTPMRLSPSDIGRTGE